MFKPISSSLKRKEQNYQQNQDALHAITQALGIFFMSALGIDLKESGVYCHWIQGDLTIQTNSKTLANELAMRLGELTRFLQEREITPVRIIIK